MQISAAAIRGRPYSILAERLPGPAPPSRRAWPRRLHLSVEIAYCCRCLDGVVVVERRFPQGSADFFFSGIFSIVERYASSTAFRFSSSSEVSGRPSDWRFMPGMNWARAGRGNKAMIAPAPLSKLMNSRRPIACPEAQAKRSYRLDPAFGKGVRPPAPAVPIRSTRATTAPCVGGRPCTSGGGMGTELPL
jgi:hypothetical protein